MSEHSDECPEESHIHAFGAIIPMPQEVSDQRRIQAFDRRNRVLHFLEGLTIEQCDVLRYMLNTAPEGAYAYNQFIDGQLVMLLRLKHQVDPDNPFESNPLAELEKDPPTDDDAEPEVP